MQPNLNGKMVVHATIFFIIILGNFPSLTLWTGSVCCSMQTMFFHNAFEIISKFSFAKQMMYGR